MIIDATYQFGVAASRCLFRDGFASVRDEKLSVIIAFPQGKLQGNKLFLSPDAL